MNMNQQVSAASAGGKKVVDRPKLTLPAREAEALRQAYAGADTILEYGSGGSTVLAAEMPGKHVTSVESDRGWARMMRRWFAQNPPAEGAEARIVYANIGPTRAWGHPQDFSNWRRFSRYPLAIWQDEEFRHPDVVLVDGRFRIGCALATAYSITRPVTLLFDDYDDRNWYKKVENYIGAPRVEGRMGIFELEPRTVPGDRLLQIVRFMQRP